MALMHFHVSYVSRGRGSNAVARAAYIARDRLRAEGRHCNFDYRWRGGLQHSEILLPAAAGRGADWARDRTQLWNAAEAAEVPRNARIAREYVIALPHELSHAARLTLARSFSQSIADRYGAAIDLAIHRPPAGGDPRNHHMHLLSTTREVSAFGLGKKTIAERSNSDRRSLGLKSGPAEILFLRHWWAERATEHLRGAGLDLFVDPRSLWERGEARVPQPSLTRAMVYMERAGVRCEAAERLREIYNARQALAESLSLEHAQSRAPEPAQATNGARQSAAKEPVEQQPTPADPASHAVERWLAYRSERTKHASRLLERAEDRDRGAELEL